MPLDWTPLWLSLRYAGMATLLAAVSGVPLAWLLAHRRFAGCELLDAFANLPLIAPPAVLIYYLLARLPGWGLVFDWRVAVGLSAVYTFPLLVRMSRGALGGVSPAFEDAARSLGAGEWRVFWRIAMPPAWRALLAACLAGFARSFADIGATVAVSRPAGGWVVAVAIATGLAALYGANRARVRA